MTPESFLLMTLAAFLVYVGNYFAPLLIAKGLELSKFIPAWAKPVIGLALGAFFVALTGAIAQLPQLQPWLDKSLLTVIFAAISALVTWMGTVVGKAQGLVIKAQSLDAQEKIDSFA